MNKKLLYPEVMRIIAIVAVCTQHVTSQALGELEFWSPNWQMIQAMHVLVQWCVPLFLMVSGIFLLDPAREITMKKIYRVYISRMLLAIVIMVPVHEFVLNAVCEHQCIIDWEFWKEILRTLLYSDGSAVYWYLYMMIGLYIYLPLYRALTRSLKDDEYLYLLIMIFIGISCISRIHRLGIESLEPIYIFFRKLKLHKMFRHGFYFMLGYYLSRHEIPAKLRYGIYGIAMVALGISLHFTRNISIDNGKYVEVWTSDSSPAQVFAVIAIFALIKQLAAKVKENSCLYRIFMLLGSLSFGVYLIHNMIICIFRTYGFGGFMGNPLWAVPLVTISVYVISVGIVFVLRKNQWFKSWM